jgi:hypothetical protein
VITQEEYNEWRSQEVTKQFFKFLKHSKEGLKEDWVRGIYEDDENLRGRCQMLTLVIDVEYEDVMERVNGE